MDALVGARRMFLVILVVTALASCGQRPGRGTAEVSSFPDAPTTAEASSTTAAESTSASSTTDPSSKAPSRTSGAPKPSGGPRAGPVNACAVPPAGRAPDGRALQRIVFPDPGSHQWPDSEVTLRACSTSGLPVTYQFEDGGPARSCWVSDPTATTVQAQGGLASCKVTASQLGNAEFAPAEPVTVTWIVNKLAVKIGWIGEADTLVYSMSAATVNLQVKVTAMHDIPYLTVDTHATGACSIAQAPSSVGGTEKKDITFDVKVALTDPGQEGASCDLYIDVRSNQVVDGSHHDRHYAVVRG